MKEFLRQRDLLDPVSLEGRDVDLVGAGALGGAILLCLCKMGCGLTNRVTVTDPDRCETHNLPTQWFRAGHVELNSLKVEAIAETAEILTERGIEAVAERFTGAEGRRLGPAVVLGVDSLEERRRIWRNLERRDDIDLILDARMGAEVLEVFAFRPRLDDHAPYEESLARPEEAFQEPCTRRAIMDTVFAGAGVVGRLYRAWVTGEALPVHVVLDLRNLVLVTEPWPREVGSPAAGRVGRRLGSPRTSSPG